jgi:hypothetical protein
MTAAEKEAFKRANSPAFVSDNKVIPTDLTPPHRNFDVDTSIYNGLVNTSSYVQLSDHENDQDDVVPEFSSDINEKHEQVIAEVKHFDFAGQEINEIYDE